MTIKELVTYLNSYPSDAEIFIECGTEGLCSVGTIFEDTHVNGELCEEGVSGKPCILIFPER